MNNKLEWPKSASLQGRLIELEHEQATRAREIGRIGNWFGGASEKPGNIAAAAIVASFILIILLALLSLQFPEAKWETLYTALFSIIALALGYVFGRGGAS
jgi:hypothetical protein